MQLVQADSQSQIPSKLFIGGLSYDTTEDSLARYFSQFGEVCSSIVLRDPVTSHSRGFGFVTFTQEQSAQNVLARGRNHIIDGRKVEAKIAIPRSATTTGNVGVGMGAQTMPGNMPMQGMKNLPGNVQNFPLNQMMGNMQGMQGRKEGMYIVPPNNMNIQLQNMMQMYQNMNAMQGLNGMNYPVGQSQGQTPNVPNFFMANQNGHQGSYQNESKVNGQSMQNFEGSFNNVNPNRQIMSNDSDNFQMNITAEPFDVPTQTMGNRKSPQENINNRKMSVFNPGLNNMQNFSAANHSQRQLKPGSVHTNQSHSSSGSHSKTESHDSVHYPHMQASNVNIRRPTYPQMAPIDRIDATERFINASNYRKYSLPQVRFQTDLHRNKVLVTNLSISTTEQNFLDFFCNFGELFNYEFDSNQAMGMVIYKDFEGVENLYKFKVSKQGNIYLDGSLIAIQFQDLSAVGESEKSGSDRAYARSKTLPMDSLDYQISDPSLLKSHSFQSSVHSLEPESEVDLNNVDMHQLVQNMAKMNVMAKDDKNRSLSFTTNSNSLRFHPLRNERRNTSIATTPNRSSLSRASNSNDQERFATTLDSIHEH